MFIQIKHQTICLTLNLLNKLSEVWKLIFIVLKYENMKYNEICVFGGFVAFWAITSALCFYIIVKIHNFVIFRTKIMLHIMKFCFTSS